MDDIFQEVFLGYFLNNHLMQNEQHEKAWICRVAFNKCKDLSKSFWHEKVVELNDFAVPFESQEQGELIKAVCQLPFTYKRVVYLHYYEGWTIPDIAENVHENISTVYSQLRRAKAHLKKKVGEVW